MYTNPHTVFSGIQDHCTQGHFRERKMPSVLALSIPSLVRLGG